MTMSVTQISILLINSQRDNEFIRQQKYKPVSLSKMQTGRCLDDLICLSMTDGTKS